MFSKYLSCNYKPRILSSDLDMDAVLSLMELMYQSEKAMIDIKGLAVRIQGIVSGAAPFTMKTSLFKLRAPVFDLKF